MKIQFYTILFVVFIIVGPIVPTTSLPLLERDRDPGTDVCDVLCAFGVSIITCLICKA